MPVGAWTSPQCHRQPQAWHSNSSVTAGAGHGLQSKPAALTPGEGALYTLNTFYAQIRPEIQISSFGFNQSLPEVQPEVSVPSYFQFPANRPIRTLPQPKATYVFALASRNNKPVQRQRFNSQCTAHLKEPKVTHITTLPSHARHY